jgi:hypothetical protein
MRRVSVCAFSAPSFDVVTTLCSVSDYRDMQLGDAHAKIRQVSFQYAGRASA